MEENSISKIFDGTWRFFRGLVQSDGSRIPNDQNLPAYVPMPEAGKAAYLFMGVDALERLEADFGEDYLEIISRGFVMPSAVIISRAMAVCLNNADDSQFPWGLTIQQIGHRLYDAQLRVIHGKTLVEILEINAGKAPAAEGTPEIKPIAPVPEYSETAPPAEAIARLEMIDPQSGFIFQKSTDGGWMGLEPPEKYDLETGSRMVVKDGAWVSKE